MDGDLIEVSVYVSVSQIDILICVNGSSVREIRALTYYNVLYSYNE
jgi:hypothetical protein